MVRVDEADICERIVRRCHNIFEFVKRLNDDQQILENMNHRPAFYMTLKCQK